MTTGPADPEPNVPGLRHDPVATADEFLDALSLRNARWQPFPDAWLFRGQADAAWHLVPLAFRPDTRFPLGMSGVFAPAADSAHQIT